MITKYGYKYYQLEQTKQIINKTITSLKEAHKLIEELKLKEKESVVNECKNCGTSLTDTNGVHYCGDCGDELTEETCNKNSGLCNQCVYLLDK